MQRSPKGPYSKTFDIYTPYVFPEIIIFFLCTRVTSVHIQNLFEGDSMAQLVTMTKKADS